MHSATSPSLPCVAVPQTRHGKIPLKSLLLLKRLESPEARTVAGQNAMPNEQTLANSLSQDSVGVRQLLAEKQHHNATSPFLRCAKQNTYWPGTRLCCRPYRDAACVTKAGNRKPQKHHEHKKHIETLYKICGPPLPRTTPVAAVDFCQTATSCAEDPQMVICAVHLFHRWKRAQMLRYGITNSSRHFPTRWQEWCMSHWITK